MTNYSKFNTTTKSHTPKKTDNVNASSSVKIKSTIDTASKPNAKVGIDETKPKTTTKPLIKPASKAHASTEPSIQRKPVTKKKPKRKFDWDSILDRTFLSLFAQKSDPLVGSGKYDYVFHIGNQRLYVLVHNETMESDSLKLPQRQISKLKQRAATNLTKRFQQVRDKLTLPKVDNETITSVYCLGLTSLSIYIDDTEYPIDHEYNSLFFQEECVLDLDDDNNVLQLFSLGGLIKIIKLLQTPSDLLTFLDYHRPIFVTQLHYDNEVSLAANFLNRPEFFERAIDVQRQLVSIGLLANIEERLVNINKAHDSVKMFDKKNKTDESVEHKELISKLQNYAQMYQKLINGLAKRRHSAGDTLPINQMKLLIDESMYTRMSIIEEVVAYADRTEAECRNGYLCHQHSYNHFGHHYVLIVYGVDDDAQYSRESVAQNYEDLLMDINSQLQDPVMKEYFILGFDMSKHDGKGNITVEIDAYHQSGSKMTAMEKRLYDQVQALSGS